jgi:hypothetical protein
MTVNNTRGASIWLSLACLLATLSCAESSGGGTDDPDGAGTESAGEDAPGTEGDPPDTSGDDGEGAPDDAASDDGGAGEGDDALLPDAAPVEDTTEADTTEPVWECVHAGSERPDFLKTIGCADDFAAVAAAPLDASIPGALSAKTVVDQVGGNSLYFQNSEKYPIHWDFAKVHLSGQGKPLVPPLGQFNQSEYYSPDRRFLLGAVTFYEEPGVWVYEISPYDTASAEMIATAYRLIAQSAFFGKDLLFHPTSQAVEGVSKLLPDDVKVISTQELFAGITFQPLNLGVSMGRLRYVNASELDNALLNFRDIVVLDRVPNDISVVAAIITAELQTPLSHINVLSQNRGTPNMALTDALDNPKLRELEDKWVELTVGAFEWSVKEVTPEEALAWWEDNKPAAVQVPNKNLAVVDLREDLELLDLENLSLDAALDEAIPAFGGKASHYGGLARIADKIGAPKAFAIPIAHYFKFMEDNGLDAWVTDLLGDIDFLTDPVLRSTRLAELREAIMDAPIDPEFVEDVRQRIFELIGEGPVRFRSSTNAEDLDGFTGAGLYTSVSGYPLGDGRPIEDAMREVWSSVWYFRAYEEREYRSIDHKAVGMALLVHRAFPDEESNGVALTANIFDTQGLEPGFYINAQVGDTSVVKPPAGVTSDALVYYYYLPGQPIVFLSHSNLVPPGETVMSVKETYALGQALEAVHKFFEPAYGPKAGGPAKFYAMDTEFKFDTDESGESKVTIKQARPHPGWGL